MLAQCLSNCVLVPIRWLPGKTTHVWGGGASVTAWMQNNLLACTCTNKHIHSWTCMHFDWEGVELCRGVVQAAAWLSLCGVVQISRSLCNNNNSSSSSNEKNIGEKSANNNGKNNKSIEKSNRTNDFVLLYVLLLVAYQVCESERRNGGKCSNGSTPDISYTTIFFILLLPPQRHHLLHVTIWWWLSEASHHTFCSLWLPTCIHPSVGNRNRFLFRFGWMVGLV